MADFLIWGRIQHLGLGEFLAIASAVPAVGGEGADVLTALMPSNDAAIRALSDLTIQLGRDVRARGNSVVDVET